jgi:hypothetical protein
MTIFVTDNLLSSFWVTNAYLSHLKSFQSNQLDSIYIATLFNSLYAHIFEVLNALFYCLEVTKHC